MTRFLENTNLERPFAMIETKVQYLKDYVGKWLQFQISKPNTCLTDWETSLANWRQLLTEIKKARSTFDTSDTQKSFGVCVVASEG